jgi:hypothetical protein
MKPSETISHKGKKITLVDLAHTAPAETLAILQDAQMRIAENPPKSVLILTDATDTVYNKEVSNAIQNFSAKNTPFVKKSAVIGVDGLRMVLLRTVILVTRREIKACATRQEALDWLVS